MPEAHPDPHILPRAWSWLWHVSSRVLGMVATVVVVLALAGFPAWRLGAIAAAYGALFAVQAGLVLSTREPGQIQRRLSLAHGALVLAHTVMLALTGGLRSPMLLMMAAVIGTPPLLLRHQTHRRLAWGVAGALCVGLALLPPAWTGPALAPSVWAILALSAFVWSVVALSGAQTLAAQANRDAQRALDKMREERVVQATEQLRRLQSVGGKVAHELKNPLAAIKGLVQLVARSSEEGRAHERLTVALSEIARMENILVQYLTFSRPLEDLVIGPVDLGTLVADVVEVMSGRAENGGVRLSSRGGRVVVPGDPRRLKEALINLVSNAIEATPPGGSVEVVVEPGPEHATITVRDTGIGMNAAHLARVGESGFTTREGGTGLGVVLARNVIRQHAGELHHDSEKGTGTTATVVLPMRSPEPPASEERAR